MVSDIEGVVYKGRPKLMDRWKASTRRRPTSAQLGEIIDGADVFLGVSAGGVLKRRHGQAHGAIAR